MMPATPVTPVVFTTPQPLAKLKQPTLLQELRQHAVESVASESAAILATGKARLWWMASGAVLALVITAVKNHPQQWFPIVYVGGSVTIALTTGAMLEDSKAKAHHNITTAITTARPNSSLASAWLNTEARQLRGFDKLVSQYLFEGWVSEQSTITVPSNPQPQSPPLSVAEDLGRFPQSALFGGVPGAGKGVTYLQALAHLKREHPDTRVMLINPKASGGETGTAKAPALVLSRDFENGGTPDELSMWLWDCVEQFKRWEGSKLLIIDEMASVMATLKLASRGLQILPQFRAFITHLTSMGDSDGRWIWLISQDCSTDGLGLSSALRATLRAVGIVSPKNRQALSAFLSGQWLPLPEGGKAELFEIMQASPVGRAIFDGKQGRWLPMERLENLTGWDRDSGKAVASTPALPASPAPFWEEAGEFDYFDIWMEWLENLQDGECTTRKASQSAPRQVRTTTAGTREAFTQLQKMGFGVFDKASDTFTVTRKNPP